METKVVFLASKVRKLANNLIEDELKKAGLEGVVPSHGDILHVLFKHDICTMQDIAKAIDRTKATTSVLVDKLEKQGLVVREKSASDSRVTLVYLTDKAKDLEKKFFAISDKLNDKVTKGMTRADLDALEILLQKVLNNLES